MTVLPVMLVAFWFCLPEPLFDDPASTVIGDRNGRLLGARIADDGQWRFPLNPKVPEKFKTSIIAFEDRCFMYHPGVNPASLVRAFIQNIRVGQIVSGGSTLSMQVIRLSRKNQPRTISEKMIEIVLALRLELRYTKSEILALYAAHAPFGGNVVGIDAASWRYYGRPSDQLSWAESATLAVLPNAPSLIYPGKNHSLLLQKRNRLLAYLLEEEKISETDYLLALAEPLPGEPFPLDQLAPHLLTEMLAEHPGENIRTTLDLELQRKITEIVKHQQQKLSFNKVHNLAALVVDNESGDIISWVGNAGNAGKTHGCDVDMVTAPRSTGSILKPFLYAAMLDDGLILPNTLIPDIPTQIDGFRPMNFDEQYAGAVSAQKALYRSLNVPAVKMLQDYGVPRFMNKLIEMGMTTLTKPADHYGLSLILGGAEVTMFDLATMYSSMSRTLSHFYALSSQYDPLDLHPPHVVSEPIVEERPMGLKKTGPLSAASIWFAFEAMRKVNRPDELAGWDAFASDHKIAWKTGTSYGFRDAWAVGVTPGYTVIVWAGNADGEGRPGLIGVRCAAPVLFEIYNLLPSSSWFDPPWDEMEKAAICRFSGHRAGKYCEPVDTAYIPSSGLHTIPCPYHQLVHLDSSGQYRVTDGCCDPVDMAHRSWFVLPPVMEWYYRKWNALYRPLPPLDPDCDPAVAKAMELVYPGSGSKIYIPVNISGQFESAIIEVAHNQPDAVLFWHLDEEYLGSTRGVHQMEVRPTQGWHTLVIVDNQGNRLEKRIEILSRDLASGGN